MIPDVIVQIIRADNFGGMIGLGQSGEIYRYVPPERVERAQSNNAMRPGRWEHISMDPPAYNDRGV